MKTAVEWLEKEIFRNHKFLLQKVDCSRLQESIEQAKEMEKQQIIDAYDLGMGHYGDANLRADAEHYYNETFKKK
jgi:hypothetical protein